MLKITTDGRKLALDCAWSMPAADAGADSKVNRAVGPDRARSGRGPRDARQRSSSSATYRRRTRPLLRLRRDRGRSSSRAGVPASEIAFIGDADTRRRKKLAVRGRAMPAGCAS